MEMNDSLEQRWAEFAKERLAGLPAGFRGGIDKIVVDFVRQETNLRPTKAADDWFKQGMRVGARYRYRGLIRVGGALIARNIRY
jgi:hypothetical protein